ncbi:MAG: TenA family protein [Chloroflexi bacterium]|nr:TenA family protein [Chloroflexota bacterium]
MSTQPSSLATRLWRAHASLAQAALETTFVRGIADGRLARDRFQRYVAQDAFFLEAFARGYALALARSPDGTGLQLFHELIGGVLDELRLHASYAARWDVDLSRVSPAPATLAYTDFLLARASLGSLGDTCAAMTPCMRLYAFLGQTLGASGGTRSDNPYHEWVATYASSDFEALARTLEDLLDRYATDGPSVRDAYRRAMELELTFFQATE